MDKIEKMFLDLNSVLVKFWIEQGRPDKETKIALLERMLNWYKKMGYVTLQTLSEEPEGLDEAVEELFETIEVHEHENIFDDTFKKIFIAGAEWQKSQILEDGIDCEVKIDAGGYPYIERAIELYDYEKDEPLAKKGDKYKLVLLKVTEDEAGRI